MAYFFSRLDNNPSWIFANTRIDSVNMCESMQNFLNNYFIKKQRVAFFKNILKNK
jgi:hypothetical protein